MSNESLSNRESFFSDSERREKFLLRKRTTVNPEDFDVLDFYLGRKKEGDFEIYCEKQSLDKDKTNRIFNYRANDGSFLMLGPGSYKRISKTVTSHVLSKIEEKEDISLAFLASDEILATAESGKHTETGFKTYKGKRANKKDIESNFTYLETMQVMGNIIKNLSKDFSKSKENWAVYIENSDESKNTAIGGIFTSPYGKGRPVDSIIIAEGKNAKRIVEAATGIYNDKKQSEEYSFIGKIDKWTGLPKADNKKLDNVGPTFAAVFPNIKMQLGDVNSMKIGKYLVKETENYYEIYK